MKKIVVKREQLWSLGLAIVVVLIVATIALATNIDQLLSFSGSPVVFLFRAMSATSILTLLLMNILIYSPYQQEWVNGLRNSDAPDEDSQFQAKRDQLTSKVRSLQTIALLLTSVCCIFALLKLTRPFLHLYLVLANFGVYLWFDQEASREIRNSPAKWHPAAQPLEESLKEYSRPMFWTHGIFFLFLTLTFVVSNLSGRQSIIIVDAFGAGMVSFTAAWTVIAFIAANRMHLRSQQDEGELPAQEDAFHENTDE